MSDNTCAGCKTVITSKEYMKCQGCTQKYDLLCADLSPKRYRKLNQESKRLWRCVECKCMNPKMDNTDTPVRSQQSKPALPTAPQSTLCSSDIINVTTRKKQEAKSNYILEEKLLEIMQTERRAVQSMIESSAKGLSAQLEIIKEQCTGFQESLSYVSKQYEDLRKEISDLKKLLGNKTVEVNNLREENKNLNKCLNDYAARLKAVENENLKQQQWVRMQNLEFVGVPEEKDEITVETVMKITKHIGVSINPGDIEFAHRVQPRRGASAARGRPIIVHLRQRAVKDRLLAAARKHRNLTAKDVGIGGEAYKIFVNEHLTIDNKMLLSSCKQKAKEVNYRYIWTKNCRIYVRKNDTSPPLPIASPADLLKIV